MATILHHIKRKQTSEQPDFEHNKEGRKYPYCVWKYNKAVS